MKNKIFDGVLLVIGNALLAFGVSFFILPNKILSGGVAGIAVALYPIFNVEPKLMMNIIIFVCFVIGLVFLGKRFAAKTVVSSILYPIFVALFSLISYQPEVDPLMASVFGGLIMGIGLGATFRTGASTGGMDIPPLILEKFTNIRVSIWILILDAITVLLGLKSFGLNSVLLGLISVFTATVAIDKMQTLGGEQAKQVFIITNKNDEVLEHIHTLIDRGSTLIQGRGGYTRDNREIIMTVLMKDQYVALEKAVREIDSDAFLIVSDVTEVHGNGFYRL